jgi:hypothetical protein
MMAPDGFVHLPLKGGGECVVRPEHIGAIYEHRDFGLGEPCVVVMVAGATNGFATSFRDVDTARAYLRISTPIARTDNEKSPTRPTLSIVD